MRCVSEMGEGYWINEGGEGYWINEGGGTRTIVRGPVGDLER